MTRAVTLTALNEQLLEAHTDQVTCVVFNHDPGVPTLASGSFDGTVRIWKLNRPGAEPTVFQTQDSVVRAVAYSPDDRWFAAGGWDGTVRLWDLHQPDAKPLVLKGRARIWALAFSPESRVLAAGGEEGAVQLWDLQQPAAPPTALQPFGQIASLAFSDDGQSLASGGWDGIIRVWDLHQPGAAPADLHEGEGGAQQSQEKRINSVAFQPHGRLLASGGLDDTIRLWDLTQPQKKPVPLKASAGDVRAVAFSPDGETLATAGQDGRIRLWNVHQLDRKPALLIGHKRPVNSLAFSSDAKLLASGDEDQIVRLWDLFPSNTEPVVLHPEAVVREPGKERSVESVAFCADGRTLATGSWGRFQSDYPVKLWDLSRPGSDAKTLEGLGAGIDAVLFDGQNDSVAAAASYATGGGQVRLWHLNALTEPPVIFRQAGGTSLAFSADGNTLASGGFKVLRIWDLRQPDSDPVILQHSDWVDSVAFSPNPVSFLLASGSHDASIRVWDLAQPGHLPAVLNGHIGKVRSVAFSPYGQKLASAGEDKTVRLWDVTNPGGKPVLLTGHADQVRAVAFSPVDSLLASASDDSTVRLWDTKHLSAQPIILRGHEGGITSVVFSRDGRFLASGGEDGTARIWIAQTAMLADKVCEKVGRNLTLDEWQRFVGKDLDYEKTCDNLPGPLAVAGSEASLRPAAQLSSVVAAYPPDKTVFRHYPRTVSLRWSVLPGAAAYTVEVEFCQTPACERPAH